MSKRSSKLAIAFALIMIAPILSACMGTAASMSNDRPKEEKADAQLGPPPPPPKCTTVQNKDGTIDSNCSR